MVEQHLCKWEDLSMDYRKILKVPPINAKADIRYVKNNTSCNASLFNVDT